MVCSHDLLCENKMEEKERGRKEKGREGGRERDLMFLLIRTLVPSC